MRSVMGVMVLRASTKPVWLSATWARNTCSGVTSPLMPARRRMAITAEAAAAGIGLLLS